MDYGREVVSLDNCTAGLDSGAHSMRCLDREYCRNFVRDGLSPFPAVPGRSTENFFLRSGLAGVSRISTCQVAQAQKI